MIHDPPEGQTQYDNEAAVVSPESNDELDADKRDAERYRYLRRGEMRKQIDGVHPADGSVWVVKYNHQHGNLPYLKSAGIGAELDAAIDAAMAASSKRKVEMNKERLQAMVAMLAAEVDYKERDLTRPLNEREKAVLAPPHPADFWIPAEHWDAAKAYAMLFSENYVKAIRKEP